MSVSIDETVFSQHSFHEAMHACARMFAASDTKWFDLLVPVAVQQLMDDTLLLSLHLRRVSEFTGKRVRRTVDNLPLGVARDFSQHETNLWRCINKVIHHRRLDPIVLSQRDFYRANEQPVAGHLISDIKVESDEGTSIINVAGFSVACANELGEQMLSEKLGTIQ